MTRRPLVALVGALVACARTPSPRPDTVTAARRETASAPAPSVVVSTPPATAPSAVTTAPTAAPVEAPAPVPGPSAVAPAKPVKPVIRAWETLCVPGAKKKGPAKSIRDVDWCSIHVAITQLKDGKAEIREYEEMGGPHDTYIFRLGHVAYGDLDGDGSEDAVVTVDETGHGTKGDSYAQATVRVFRWVKGAATPSNSVTAFGVVEATIAKKTLEVRAERATETCIGQYVWKSGELTEVGSTTCKAN